MRFIEFVRATSQDDGDREVIPTHIAAGSKEETQYFRVMHLHATDKTYYETKHDYMFLNGFCDASPSV